METNLIQSTILAIVQGLTEFLPISSSAHLILPSQILGWQDQGLAFDVAVHVGSLLAVLVYFHLDLRLLITAWLGSIGIKLELAGRSAVNSAIAADFDDARQQYGQLAWCLLIASLPAAVAGFLARDLVSAYGRDAQVIAFTSIFFGLLLWWADSRMQQQKSLTSLTWRQGMMIGLAQALAIIPGTSRSGVTMTAALILGFTRETAARFSFLLAIPVILGSGLLEAIDLIALGVSADQWLMLAYGAIVSAVCAFLCIHYFLRLIARVGYLPFVIYRVVLGVFLLLFGLL